MAPLKTKIFQGDALLLTSWPSSEHSVIVVAVVVAIYEDLCLMLQLALSTGVALGVIIAAAAGVSPLLQGTHGFVCLILSIRFRLRAVGIYVRTHTRLLLNTCRTIKPLY